MNRLGTLEPSGRHPEAGFVLSHTPCFYVVCTTLLPTIYCEHCKGRDCVGFTIFLWCLIGTQCGYQP